MKKFLFVLFGLFVFAGAFAAGENIPTSKSYVDTAVATKQDTIPANDGAAQVLTNTGTAGEYDTKGIYDATGEYAVQQNNLVDAATMNAGVQNAIDSEFQCIEWLDPNDHTSDCLLMDVFGTPPQQILPNGFTALEYLESTGTQYIDTGIVVNNNIGISIDFQYSNSSTTEQALFGHVSPNFGFWRVGAQFVYGYKVGMGATGSFIVEASELLQRHILEFNFYNNHEIKLDNTTKQLPYTIFSSNRTLYLFAHNRNHNVFTPSKSRVFFINITDGTEFVRNFIPARRNGDGVLGMYDTVSNTFFTNNGTGEFIAGPVVYMPQGE